ncbi:alpha-mannosidase-like isoform X2 [Magnolia sinica]|uniref:alpha-mannosidase-like isoform X2 n=1 Tax=Magnolia sinica TaxID=86752 RepID=UPI002659EE8A|nr:alpha-mannosidase-like isoform X2 [Magnolia sinica]
MIYWKDFLKCQGTGNVLTAKARASSGHMSVTDTSQNETLEVGPGNLKMSFSSTFGQLKHMTNYRTGVKDLDVELESTKQKSKQNLQQAILIERKELLKCSGI